MKKKMCTLTLTTDFGLKDAFVGIMKGVILSIEPNVRIVDLTHDIERHNVEEALYTLTYVYDYFPPGTIHVVVVDPGVGTNRRPLLVQEENYLFLAPDNGVLSFLFDQKPELTVREITSQDYFRKPVSQTFHGRDIFAPVAAWLAQGVQPEKFGSVISDYTRLNIPQLLISEQRIRGEVIHVDRFGNLITNIKRRHVESLSAPSGEIVAESKGVQVRGLYTSYAENTSDQPGLIFNSFELLEIFCFKGSAQDKTGLSRGNRIQVFEEE
jgi:S-adenosylmethionine hydrolase